MIWSAVPRKVLLLLRKKKTKKKNRKKKKKRKVYKDISDNVCVPLRQGPRIGSPIHYAAIVVYLKSYTDRDSDAI